MQPCFCRQAVWFVTLSLLCACSAGIPGITQFSPNKRTTTTALGTGKSRFPATPAVAALAASTAPTVAPSTVEWELKPGSLKHFAGAAGRPIIIRDAMAMSIDADGNLYITDGQNRRLSKLSPDGTRTTFAGGATADVMNDPLQSPLGLTRDAMGNFYITEPMRNLIHKITPDGKISPFADAQTTQGKLRYPFGITGDAKGAIYVANWGDHRIIKILADGTASVFAGGTEGNRDGSVTEAQFNKPRDLVFDAAGNLLVADSGNHRIRKVTPDGTVSTLAGSSKGWADGNGVNARFDGINGLAMGKDGSLYVVDAGNQRIRKVSATGDVTTLAGSTKGQKDGTGSQAQFSFAFGEGMIALAGIAVDDKNVVWVIDSLNATLRSISPTGVVSTVQASRAGYLSGTRYTAQFSAPDGIAVLPDGAVYVADRDNHRIRLLASTGFVTNFVGSTAGMADKQGKEAQLRSPCGMVSDAARNLYMCDRDNHRIRRIAPGGTVTTVAGSAEGFADGTGAQARFNRPRGLAIDSQGVLYVADTGNHRIRKIMPDGTVSTIAGAIDGFVDGVTASAQFSSPQGLTVDSAGNLFVADTGNHRIRKITPDGLITTIAGSSAGFADGLGGAARFNSPRGITIDAAGALYIADTNNHRIRIISPDGKVYSWVGSTQGETFGAGAQARLNAPSDICLDAKGRLLVSDQGNHCVRLIERDSPPVVATESPAPTASGIPASPAPTASNITTFPSATASVAASNNPPPASSDDE